jgi:antitoxin (DNA-binding transcriptional repressor) of toxin-antitoxin stability system
MPTLNIREARNALGHLEELLTTSGELIITKHGNAIARILPVQGKLQRPSHEDLHCLTPKLSVSSEKLVRDSRDER